MIVVSDANDDIAVGVDRLFRLSIELAEMPLEAAQAYDNIVTAIREAEQAALAALNASQAAFEKVSCLAEQFFLSTIVFLSLSSSQLCFMYLRLFYTVKIYLLTYL